MFQVDGGVTAKVSGLTISGGSGWELSGGGGVENHGDLTITGCSISDNSGVFGAIYNWNLSVAGISAPMLTVSDSTIANNYGDFAGGIYNELGTVTVINSTIAHNTSNVAGGGIFNDGDLSTVNCTIADNTPVAYYLPPGHPQPEGGGGLYVADGGTATLDNTIVAQNDDTRGPDDVDGAGIAAASSNNLVGVDESGTVAGSIDPIIVGPANPGLEPLGYYDGGSTETIALCLSPISPAIHAGSLSLAVDQHGNALQLDQNGNLRIDNQSGHQYVDIGAVEADLSQLPSQPSSVTVNANERAAAPGTPVLNQPPTSEGLVGYNVFNTIQDGVNNVAAGGTVNIARGTYSEQVTISKDLTLVGAGTSLTTLQDPTNSGNEIQVQGGVTVTLLDFNVDAASAATAIDVAGGSLSATDVTVTGYATGIMVQDDGSAALSGDAIDESTTGVEFASGGSGSLDGTTFGGTAANTADLAIASGAGTVSLGTTAPNVFSAASIYIDNDSPQTIDASDSSFSGVNPATASLGQLFAIQSKIADGLNNPAPARSRSSRTSSS